MTLVLARRGREAEVTMCGGNETSQGEAELKKGLQGLMQLKSINVGDRLFYEGDEVEALYYIKSGRVKLTKTNEDGKEIILSFMQADDLVGEFGGTEGDFHGYEAEIVEAGMAGVIMIRDLEIYLSQNGEMALEFIRLMGTAQRMLQYKLRDLLMNGKAGALASMLVRACNSYGKMTPEGILITKKMNHADIAELIGATRENVTKTLSGWKEQGIVEVAQGRILVRELSELHQICGCPVGNLCSSKICRM